MTEKQIEALIGQFQDETGAELSWNIVNSSFGMRRSAGIALGEFIAKAAALEMRERCAAALDKVSAQLNDRANGNANWDSFNVESQLAAQAKRDAATVRSIEP